jgi:hypothetical protein
MNNHTTKKNKFKFLKICFSLFAFLFLINQSWGQTSYTSTSVTTAWNAARWNNSADGPTYTSTYTANQPVTFTSGTYDFSTGIGSGTINIGNINLSNNVIVNFSGTTAGTFATGGNVRTITVGSGALLNTAGQGISTAAGTGFIKNGSGAWLSSNGGAFPGGFTLNSGTMLIGGVNAMGNGGALILNGGTIAATTGDRAFTTRYSGITIGGNVQFGDVGANFSQITADTRSMTFGNNVDLGGTVRTFTIGNSGNTTFQGIVSNGGLIIQSANANAIGAIVFNTAANTFDGTLTVNSGRLTAGLATSLGSTVGNTTVNSGGCLRFGFDGGISESFIISGQGTVDGQASGIGALRKTGGSAQTTINGGVTLNGDALIVGASGNGFRFNTLGINGNGYALTIGGDLQTEVNVAISGIGTTLLKEGNGTLLLQGANSYNGLTTVSAGTLKLNKTGGTTIPITNSITVSGGTLQISSDQTLANLNLSGGGNLTIDAGVTLTITGVYTPGAGTINNLGTIVLNGAAAQSFPGSSTTINNGTAGTLTNLTIDNSNGVTLDKSFTVAGTLTLTAGALSLAGNTLTLNGAVSGSGTLSGSSTSNLTIGGNAGTLNFTSGSRSLNNLTVTATSGTTTLGTALDIYGKLGDVASGATLDLNGQSVVLKAGSYPSTAVVGQISGTLSGASNVTVERYIPVGKRAYRQLSSGVTTTNFISNNWQLGMHITGNVGTAGTTDGTTGFDNTQTGQKNVFTYTPGATNFTGISNTNATNLDAYQGYRVFVMGDRTANLTVLNNTGTGTSNIASTATTLTAVGTLVTGSVTYNSTTGLGIGGPSGGVKLGANNNEYALIANPYWSPVNWDALSRTNVSSTYYIWDPTIGLRGAYVSWTSGSGSSNGSSAMSNHIQPGQAIFVQTTGASPSITFTEANKSSSFTSTFRPAGLSPSKLGINLIGNYNGTDILRDGATINFRDDYTANVTNEEDAIKYINSDENIAIVHNNTILGLESRPTATSTDIIPLRLWALYNNNTAYTLKLYAQDFDAGIQAYLKDKKNNTQTAINMSGETTYPFIFTSTDSSSFYNRFEIVFSNTTLPANFTNVKAYRKNTGIQVEWDIAAETAIKTYEVQRSENADGFTTVATQTATANNGKAVNYDWFDANPFNTYNFYRIKVVGVNGEVKYSSIVKVGNSKETEKVSVYPNPLEGNVVTLQLGGIADGKYEVQLFSSIGQQMMSTSINKQGAVQTQTLSLPKHMSVGVYRLAITAEDGTIYNRNIIKL